MRTIGILSPRSANEKVIGFDIAVDQILLVYRLHTRDLSPFIVLLFRGTTTEKARVTHHLPRSHAYRLDRELAPTHVEQVLEAGPQQVNNQDIVQALLTEMVYLRNAHCARGSVLHPQSGRLSTRKEEEEEEEKTHSIPPVCDTTCIHREVEELPPFWAPTRV